jgi:hypothetical protein
MNSSTCSVEWLSSEVSEHMCPVIRDFFVQMYEHPENYIDPDQQESSHNQLIKFQLALKKIPNWTNTQIKKQIDEITNRCNWFKQLLVGLFVAYINMISNGIRTSSKSKRLNLKLPSDETFVHTCFVTCASDLYEDPYIMKEPEKKRDSDLDKRIQKCILKSIYKLIPTRDILNEHIPMTNDSVTLGESEEPEIPEPVPGPETETEKIPEPQTNEEPKTIPMTPVSQEDEQPDLFPDAPEEKKLMSDDEEETKIKQ